MSTSDKESVEALVARGDYAGAAAMAAAAGDLRRAIALFERVWRFHDAVPLALTLGDRALAIRLALDAQDVPLAIGLAAEIADDAPEGLAAASDIFAVRGLAAPAAELAVRAGRWERAAVLYDKAGLPLEAGAMLERAGRWQEAGKLYERVAATEGSDPERREGAQAHLALGRLLGALGRPLDAARALQAAARHPTTQAAAQRRLCAELLALGLPHAAEEIVRRLRGKHPDLPASAKAIADAERQGGATAGSLRSGPCAVDPPVPRRFQVRRVLGGGSIGRVYEAHDELFGRLVALKVLSVGPGAVGPEQDAFRLLLREAGAAGRLSHPNIIALHEVDETAGFLVLEHAAGGTLAERVDREGALAPASVRRLGMEILSALAAAHRAGFVHRDIKPANIFFDGAGNAKLGDFGAAHLLDFGHTQTGAFIGTLAYISPEQISGSRIGAVADLYALGATLFEAITGRPPFLGPDLVGQHLAEEPPIPSALRPGLSTVHDQTILRALAKAPQDRFPTADAMAEAIAAWPPVDTAPPPSVFAVGDNATTPAPAPLPADRRRLGRTRNGHLYLALEPRVGRTVLIEELDEPLDGPARARLQLLAAAGGPHVQRVLALSADARTVTYELVEGQNVALASLDADERETLADAWTALEPLSLGPTAERRVVRANGGAVILVCDIPLFESDNS